MSGVLYCITGLYKLWIIDFYRTFPQLHTWHRSGPTIIPKTRHGSVRSWLFDPRPHTPIHISNRIDSVTYIGVNCGLLVSAMNGTMCGAEGTVGVERDVVLAGM